MRIRGVFVPVPCGIGGVLFRSDAVNLAVSGAWNLGISVPARDWKACHQGTNLPSGPGGLVGWESRGRSATCPKWVWDGALTHGALSVSGGRIAGHWAGWARGRRVSYGWTEVRRSAARAMSRGCTPRVRRVWPGDLFRHLVAVRENSCRAVFGAGLCT